MAFRYSGTAWDGQKWVAAPAIVTFGWQIEAIRPGTFAADGTVASEPHDAASPNSDHTVWPKTGSGIVYAIDFTEISGFSVDDVCEAVRQSKDPRCKYMIHDQQMFSSYAAQGYKPFTWRPYSGLNGHHNHGHLSVHHTASLANSTKPWTIKGAIPVSWEPTVAQLNAINAMVKHQASRAADVPPWGKAGWDTYNEEIWDGPPTSDPGHDNLVTHLQLSKVASFIRGEIKSSAPGTGVSEAKVKELISGSTVKPPA